MKVGFVRYTEADLLRLYCEVLLTNATAAYGVYEQEKCGLFGLHWIHIITSSERIMAKQYYQQVSPIIVLSDFKS